MNRKAGLVTLQARLGLLFEDVSLLERALIHRSYVHEHPEDSLEDNERLEFLGDSILDFVAADWLFHRLPEMPEGNLTRLRAALVQNESLAKYAVELGLDQLLCLGRGEEGSGGRGRTRNLGGAFEAVAGALYLDQGLEAVRQFATPYFAPVLEPILRENADKDAKSRLQEYAQSTFGITPLYRTIDTTGPDHAREFTVEVVIGDRVFGQGIGRSKQAAAQAAAQAALATMQTQE